MTGGDDFTKRDFADDLIPDDTRARLEMIAKSGLFDRAYYLAQCRARGLGVDAEGAELHYLSVGDFAGVPPHVIFDVHFYREKHAAALPEGVPALVHYLARGDAAGLDPHPLFDVAFTRARLGPTFRDATLVAYLASRGPELAPHPLIDPEHIWRRQRELAPGDESPSLLFYLRRETDDLNPSRDFDTWTYRRRHPDTRGMKAFYHYVRYGLHERRSTASETLSPRAVEGQIELAASLDPDVLPWNSEIGQLPVHWGYDAGRSELRLASRLSAGVRSSRHVILTPWLKKGGAERVVTNIAASLSKRSPDDRVTILCTLGDERGAAEWLPVSENIAIVGLADILEKPDDTFVAMCNWLKFAKCEYLYVVNSEFGWDLVARHGHVLNRFMTTIGFVFAYGYDAFGRRHGYSWGQLRHAFASFSAFVSDNEKSIATFGADHFVSARNMAKFHCLYQPVDSALKGRARSASAGRPRVLWAARFGREKGVDLVLDIAAATPEVDFTLCGGAISDLPRECRAPPGNVIIAGPYAGFSDLPLEAFSLFLHTSRSDGLPNVLLEAGRAGLAIVATDVGGVSDLVDSTTGWLVPAGAGAGAYREHILAALADPESRTKRGAGMAARIEARHAEETFDARLSGLLERARASRGTGEA